MGVEQVVRVCFVSLQGVLCCLFVSNGEKCQQRSGKRTRSPFLDPKNQRTVSIVQMRVRTLEYNETDEIRNLNHYHHFLEYGIQRYITLESI